MPKRKGPDEENSEESPGKKLKESNGNKPENGNGQPPAEQKEDTTTANDINRLSSDGRDHNLKICSWNVAGLRAVVKKNGMDYVKEEDADIVCFLETKAIEKEVPPQALAMKKGGKIFAGGKSDSGGYHQYLYPAEKKGYSGVALWSKVKPLSVKYGMGIGEHDKEGRLITAEYEKFYLLTSYVPNSGKGLKNLDYRRTWNTALQNYMNELNKTKPAILCGDLNVAHEAIDLKNPKANRRNAGFTQEERDDFSTLLADGYIDSYRHLNPGKEHAYTFWTFMANARSKDIGWRLDYFVIPTSLESSLCNSIIRKDVMGSDHCPIILTMAM